MKNFIWRIYYFLSSCYLEIAVIRVKIYSDFIHLDFVHVSDANRLEPFAVT